MASFSLPVDMETRSGFETFLKGIEDPTVRAGVRTQVRTMPPAAVQMTALVEDQEFLKLATEVISSFQGYANNTVSADVVRTQGQKVNAYVSARYPAALAALTDYAQKVAPDMAMDGETARAMMRQAALSRIAPVGETAGVRVSIAANAVAVANAVVLSNAAVATNVVVAAEAVFVVGVFVII